MKVAIISDASDFFDRVKSSLSSGGYAFGLYPLSCDVPHDATKNGKSDIVIIDFIADYEFAVDTLNNIRKESKVHCIAVLDDENFIDFDYKSGVDNFVLSGSLEKEILLRVRLFQWKHDNLFSNDTLVASEFVVDTANYEVYFRGKKVIGLTYKEFELLKFLVTNIGRVYSRDDLLSQVWGYNYYGGTRTVDVHIRRLRAKIGLGANMYLKTVRNVGYKFEPWDLT